MLRKIFGPQLEEVVGGSEKMHNEELMKMRWVGHVAFMRVKRNTIFWLENLKGRDDLEDLYVDGKIRLE
jgi:hypothetical protein